MEKRGSLLAVLLILCAAMFASNVNENIDGMISMDTPSKVGPSVSFQKAGVNAQSPAHEMCDYTIPELDGPCENSNGVCDGQRKVCRVTGGPYGYYPLECTAYDYAFGNPDYEDKHEITCDDGLDNDCDGTYDFPSLSNNPDMEDCQEGPSDGDYFVSKDGDNSDGLSWNTAFNDIQTVFDVYDIDAGDVIVVGKGTYYETVEPDSNDGGSLNNNVVLMVKEGDEVLIDGEEVRFNAFNLQNVNYFVIDGFKINNYDKYSMRIEGGVGNVVRNCHVIVSLHENNTAGCNRAGIKLSQQENCLIENNFVTTDNPGSSICQTDGIIVTHSNYAIVRNNEVVLYNAHDIPHNDNVQMWNVKNLKIHNNYLLQPLDVKQQHGILIEAKMDGDLGYWESYNNVVAGYWGQHGFDYDVEEYDVQIDQRVYNNIIVELGDEDGKPFSFTGDNIYFKNNILRSGRGNILGSFKSLNQNPDKINYNLYKRDGYGADVVVFGPSGTDRYTLSEFQGLGFEQNGTEVDPLLDDDDRFRPVDLSPIIDAGVDLSAYFDYDFEWVQRPIDGDNSGSAEWDIGSYEYMP
jgi:hypothetical protein